MEKHGDTIVVARAVDLLRQLVAKPSRPISGATVEQKPQVVEVWFVLNTTPTASTPLPLQAVHGTTEVRPDAVIWRTTDLPDRLAGILKPGGRLSIRIHAGHLMAEDGRMFSAALDAATGIKTLKGAGGVHETWLFFTP